VRIGDHALIALFVDFLLIVHVEAPFFVIRLAKRRRPVAPRPSARKSPKSGSRLICCIAKYPS
jgi:hypothetical protein